MADDGPSAVLSAVLPPGGGEPLLGAPLPVSGAGALPSSDGAGVGAPVGHWPVACAMATAPSVAHVKVESMHAPLLGASAHHKQVRGAVVINAMHWSHCR